jgi:hypothetical protein
MIINSNIVGKVEDEIRSRSSESFAKASAKKA